MFAIKKNGYLNLNSFYNTYRLLYRQQTNEVGVQMINEKFRSLIFCEPKTQSNPNCIEQAKKHLQTHNLNINSIDCLKDVEDLKIPDLNGLIELF
jgi:hypothetical protein